MSHIMFGTVVSTPHEKEGQSGLPAYRCAGPSCTSGPWTVEILSAHDQLWRVSSATDGSYLIAGMTPACPWCGGDLAVNSESRTKPFMNELLSSMNGSHQPGQAINELQWN